MSVLILGATGMLGSSLLRFFAHKGIETHATARSRDGLERWFPPKLKKRFHTPVDANDLGSVFRVLNDLRPDIVINCIGVIKQLGAAKDPLQCISVNALFPHRLAKECERVSARLIHISTDCVFSGKQGMYTEDNFPDCDDLYGRSKLLGEVNCPGTVTLRTSIIGHELNTSFSLISWFLQQDGSVHGYSNAIFSGFPAIEIARIIAELVIPNLELTGLYHLSSEPISKYNLLRLVAKEYEKVIKIVPYDEFVCDRSLDSSRFRQATGYSSPSWPELVAMMHAEWVGRYDG